MITTHPQKLSTKDRLAIRHLFLRAAVSMKPSDWDRAMEEVGRKFTGTRFQHLAIRAWIKIFPARVIREAGAQGKIDPQELLALTYGLHFIRTRGTYSAQMAIARKTGISPANLRAMSDRLASALKDAPIAAAQVVAVTNHSDTFSKMTGPILRQDRAEVGLNILSILRENARASLRGASLKLGEDFSVHLSPLPATRALSSYLGYVTEAVPSKQLNWLLALALSGEGKLTNVRRDASELGISIAGPSGVYLKKLKALHLIDYDVTRKKLSNLRVEPCIALALSLDFASKKRMTDLPLESMVAFFERLQESFSRI